MKRTFCYLSGRRIRGSKDTAVIPGRCEASNPEVRDSPRCNCTSEFTLRVPRNDGAIIVVRGQFRHSQLSSVAECKRRYPPGVFVQNQRPRDRGLGALAAVFPLAEPAVDTDRRPLGLFQIQAGGIDQFARVPDFTAEPDRKARLR